MEQNLVSNQRTPITFTPAGFKSGVRRGAPLAPTAFAYGLVFGILARQAGMRLSEAFAMSALVAAGSSQFVAVELWQSPLPAATIITATLIVNLRHVLLSASLYPWLSRLSRRRRYASIFFLYDESWALTLHAFRGGYRDGAFLLGCGLTLFILWLGATLLGHTLSAMLPEPARLGLDFAATAVFTALLVGLWRGPKADLLPWGVAALVAIVAERWLAGTWYILLGGLAGSLVGALRRVA